MKITLCEAAHDERGQLGYEAHEKGDQTGDEVRFHEYYQFIGGNKSTPWTYVFRPTDANVANAIAIRMEQAVRNNNVGYGQPNRGDIRDVLSVDPDPSHINRKVDCDCSSLVNTIVWVTLKSIGVTTSINGLETTFAMCQKYLKEKKWFKNVIGEVDLATGKGLKRGDILVRASSHTAVVTEVVNESVGTVTTGLYLRRGAGSLYSIITAMEQGAKVTILEEARTITGALWYKVQYRNVIGYCSSKYVRM